jgi:ribosomal protein S18 acetylase RimI-like enzyme
MVARSFVIRPANGLDIEALAAIDMLAQTSSQRREFIMRSVANGRCSVLITPGGQPAGYGVLDYSFYEYGFVPLIYVDAAHRCLGAGRLLLRHLENLCQTPKLFTSTNLSNLAMQALLGKMDYRLSGVLHDLDEGDPELVYVKYLLGHRA